MNDTNPSNTDDLVYQQSYTVRIHEVTADKTITIPALLKLLQETSMQHIMKLKASVWDLAEHKISWVLLRKQLNILAHAKMGDRITVLTYPTGFDKFFAYRDFLVFSADKKLLATSSSTWSLIDTETRKLTKVPDQLQHLVAPPEIKRLSRVDTKMPQVESLVEVDSQKVRHYDLDWNSHVNNVVLCRMMLENMIANGIKESDIKVCRFIFKNESRLGDQLDTYVDTSGKYAEVVRDDKTVAMAVVGLTATEHDKNPDR